MAISLTPEEVGRKIRKIRKQKGFSQDDIAPILGIPRSSIVQMEKGKRNLSLIEAKKLSEALGFSVDSFISNTYQISSDLTLVEEPEIKSDMATMRDSRPVYYKSMWS